MTLPAALLLLVAQADDSPRYFSLPSPRDTNELVATAQEHLRDGRVSEAITALQRLLEDHAGEVLSTAGARGRPDYDGAGEWALARLLELSEPGRAEYRARYEPRAAEALALARAAPTRAGLTAVARRWPLCPSAVEAWWALGDLELEAGEAATAALAWNRARERATRLALDLAPAGARLQWLEQHGPLEPRRPVSLPRGDAVPWTRLLDTTPFSLQGNPIFGHHCLQPVSDGALVLVGTTLRLYALDAFTGETRWQTEPPRGWARLIAQGKCGELFQGIQNEELWLAPAFGAGVALAVLQEPFAEDENENWQGIDIMKSIPERRLHAFDLATGRELWNHAPELDLEGLHPSWDGRGTFPQRMMVAGTPTVAGARVLVPSYRMQGRIDYHVACYELATGAQLWSTLVISGQRERNMFGRSVVEFAASPLVVAGERVLAQTELGTVAALDLFTGRVLWQSTYKQIDLPKTRNYSPPQRRPTWKLGPPAVAGDVAVCAPSDSRDLVAFSVSSGAELWTYSEDQLQELDQRTEMSGFKYLLGADADTVYLAGGKLSALQKPGGLASRTMFFPRWTRDLERSDTAPRPVLAQDVILAPNANRRLAFDRRTGDPVAALTGDWKGGEAGNLWLGEGALFSLSVQGVSGYFDWEAQLERARRLAAESQGDEPTRAAAELFLRRGALALDGRDLALAREMLEEARTLFARLRGTLPAAASELVCARKLAQALVGLGREGDALAVLESARALATRPDERAGLLFQAERVLRARGGAARLALLEEIGATLAERDVPAETRAESVAAWLRSTPGGESAEAGAAPLAAGLWVAIERAGERLRAGDLAGGLADLHEALRLGRDLELARGIPLGAFLRERIAHVLELPGGREAYAPIEARAAAELAEAAGDPRMLAELAARFPHANAAAQALDLLLEGSVAQGDAPRVAELVAGALASGSAGPEHESELLLALAEVLAERGNTAFQRALVRGLVRADPARAASTRDRRGRTLAELAEATTEASEPAELPPSFSARVVQVGRQRAGRADFLGTLLPAREAADGSPRELHVYASERELSAYSSAAPGTPLWTHALEQPLDVEPAAAFAPGRMLYTTRAGLTCLDERGALRWTRALGDDPPAVLQEWSGVVVTRARGTVRAFDSLLGLPLWQHALGAGGNWSGPLLGDGHAVFFSPLHGAPARVVVFDLFRGRITADFRLAGSDAGVPLAEAAWIAEERLLVPSFQARPAALAAYALADGRRAWTLELGRDEELRWVARSEGRSFAITVATALGSAAGNGGVYEIDERSGSVRRIVPLRPGEQVMGLEPQRTTALAAPYLFGYGWSENERSVPVRAIHLPYGVQWSWSLGLGAQELYLPRSLPMPAVSADCVAIAYHTQRTGAGTGGESAVVFLDKRSGKKLELNSLGGGLELATRLELRGLGPALFVIGKGPSQGGTCLDVLEELR